MENLDEKWSIHKVVQEAIEKAHITPAPETLKRLDELNKKMDDNYSKRELDEHFIDMGKRFDNQDKLLESLNTKVGVQNGRVTKSETTLKAIWMAIGAITFLFGIITSLVIYSFNLSQENLKTTILLEVNQMKK